MILKQGQKDRSRIVKMITETKNIIIVITALVGLIIYTIVKNIKKTRKHEEEYKEILTNKQYKVKGQYQ